MIPGFAGCTAIDMTRPDVIAGPMERALRPAKASALKGEREALSAREALAGGRWAGDRWAGARWATTGVPNAEAAKRKARTGRRREGRTGGSEAMAG